MKSVTTIVVLLIMIFSTLAEAVPTVAVGASAVPLTSTITPASGVAAPATVK